MREHYLPQLFQTEVDRLKNILIDQPISITIDETTDTCGRSVVNVLFSFQNQTKLVKTDYLDSVNHSTISQLILTTLNFYDISFDKVILFISDNAAYMKKAYSDILVNLMPQLKHNCCFAHILSLVGDCWINFDNFKLLSRVTSYFKDAFSYSSARKRRWLNFLTSNIVSLDSPLQLPPLFVKTRWNSWFNFVIWIKPYFPYLVQFFIMENMLNDPPKSVKELAEILSNHENISIIEMIIEFISLNAQQ
jgi:hypothetical protein